MLDPRIHPRSDQSPVDRLFELNAEISRLEAEAKRLKSDRRATARQASKCVRRARYLRFLHWFRSPAKTTNVWPMLVLTIGPFLVATSSMIMVDLIFDSRLYALGGFLLGGAVGGRCVLHTALSAN